MTDPHAIREAALATDGVLAMHRGPHGTAAAYSPGIGRVWGVRVADDRIDVHVVAEEGRDLRAVGRAVRDAVRGTVGDYPGEVTVHIEDIATRIEPGSAPSGAGASPVDTAATARRTP